MRTLEQLADTAGSAWPRLSIASLALLVAHACAGPAAPADTGATPRADPPTTTATPTPPAPTAVTDAGLEASGGGGVRSVVLETWRGCAIRVDRTVVCWGTAHGGAITEESLLPGAKAPRVVPGLADVAQIAIGGAHGCAALRDGTARCWGSNTMGQLGDGTIEDRESAVAVAGLRDVVEVGAGSAHSCARLADGTVHCWGANTQAQLAMADAQPATSGALGSPFGSFRRPVFRGPTASQRPVAIAGIAGATGLSVHQNRTCAIHGAAHDVACWGAESGSTRVEDATPERLAGVTGVASISRHDSLTCAALLDGSVRCVGANQHGQAGDGSAETYRTFPVVVAGLSNAASVAAAGEHACALTRTGDVLCWGDNSAGQIGDGGTTTRRTPVRVIGLHEVVSLAVTGQVSCAAERSGRLLCWGNDDMGQLGDGSARSTTSPSLVDGLTDAAEIAMGLGFACARRVGGTVVCWGSNTHGQLGDGTHDLRPRPVPVRGVSGATVVATEGASACAATSAGVRCWGANEPGASSERADGGGENVVSAVPGSSGVTALTVADDVRCARSGRAPWRCWGRSVPLGIEPVEGAGPRPTTPTQLADAGSLVIEFQHACGVSRAGEVVCTSGGGTNAPIAGLGPVRALRGYASRLCVVRSGGAVDCTETFEGLAPSARGFTRVRGLEDAIDVGVGNSFHCALRRAGTVACWGSNYDGQLGRGTRTAAADDEPTDVPGLTDVVQLVVSNESVCARQRSGTVRCWGGNNEGQSGNGAMSAALSPVDLTARVATAAASTSAAATADAGAADGATTSADATVAGTDDHASGGAGGIAVFCRDPARILGLTDARATVCRTVNAALGLVWVVIQGPGVPNGWLARVVVVRAGAPVAGHGIDAMSAFFRSVRLYEVRPLSSHDVLMVIEHFDAFPPGFDRNADDVGRRAALPPLGLARNPFTLTIAQPESFGGGFVGGRGGGVSPPPSWHLATLRGDASYHFTWTVRDLGRAY